MKTAIKAWLFTMTALLILGCGNTQQVSPEPELITLIENLQEPKHLGDVMELRYHDVDYTIIPPTSRKDKYKAQVSYRGTMTAEGITPTRTEHKAELTYTDGRWRVTSARWREPESSDEWTVGNDEDSLKDVEIFMGIYD